MSSLKEVKKYEDLSFGQKALATKCGGLDNVLAIIQEERVVKVEEVLLKLFDKNGRRIPENLKAVVCDPDYKFRLEQPQIMEEVHYANRILRLHGKLNVDTGIVAEQFKHETERLLEIIRGNSQIANITNGI